MRKMKRTLSVIAVLLVIAIPFSLVPVVMLAVPSQYDNAYTGALDEKLSRLESIEEDKIVIVGGSSAAFGFDSALIEKYMEMPVVNTGLYAALGTKIMLDLTQKHIKKGDLVVLAPELDAQTLSMFFSSDTTLRAMDGNFSYLLDVDPDHYSSLFGESFEFAFEKLGYFLSGNAPDPSGAYNAKYFNEYGDLAYPRSENEMLYYYDPNTKIRLNSDILNEEFCAYLNNYIAHCKSVGARVVFSYCPMNELAIEGGYDYEAALAFESYLRERIGCEFISYIEDYIIDPGYFYDTNFHLNDVGVKRHTSYFIQDLMLFLGKDKPFTDEIPTEAPELPERDVRYPHFDENSKYFTYEKTANGSYMITGVKEEYRTEKTLTVPLGYEGYKVSQIGYGAFSGTSLETLILTEDTNMRFFSNGAFSGASKLKSLYIYYPVEEDIAPPADFVGVASGFTVYIPEGSDYRNGYYWSERGLTFEYID